MCSPLLVPDFFILIAAERNSQFDLISFSKAMPSIFFSSYIVVAEKGKYFSTDTSVISSSP